MKKQWLLLLFLFGMLVPAFAQQEDEATDEDDTTASAGVDPAFEAAYKEKYVLLSDAVKAKDYAGAEPHLEWLLDNKEAIRAVDPARLRNAYIRGVKIYTNLYAQAVKAKDDAALLKYQDKILSHYQDRADQGFAKDNPVLLMLTRGKYLYQFLNKREDVEKIDLFKEYEAIFNATGEDIDRTNLTFYMIMAMNMTVANKNAEAKAFNYDVAIKKAERDQDEAAKAAAEKELAEFKASDEYTRFETYNEDWMLDTYDQIIAVADSNIEKGGPKAAEWQDSKDKITALLPQVVEINCEFVNNRYGDILKNEPNNVDVAKRALKYMLQAKCTDDPLFVFAARNAYAAEPTAGLASVIASRFIANDNLDSAIFWKEKAISMLDEDPQEAADQYMDLSTLQYKKGQLSSARSSVLKAAELDPGKEKKAYEFIGDLYMNSYNSCKEGNPVQQRGVFLAAYDAYARAGASSKMNNARNQFPSAGDAFNFNAKEGDEVKVGCWINRTTKLRLRPK